MKPAFNYSKVKLEEMSKERKVVALVRRHLDALDKCPLADSPAAMTNVELAQEASERFGLGELAHATMDHDQLSTKEGREAVFNYLDDPAAYLDKANNRIEKFKEYLK